jgi:hypothetical protein
MERLGDSKPLVRVPLMVVTEKFALTDVCLKHAIDPFNALLYASLISKYANVTFIE